MVNILNTYPQVFIVVTFWQPMGEIEIYTDEEGVEVGVWSVMVDAG
jgi:hypothetical protein